MIPSWGRGGIVKVGVGVRIPSRGESREFVGICCLIREGEGVTIDEVVLLVVRLVVGWVLGSRRSWKVCVLL